jgi:hypothetical protein
MTVKAQIITHGKKSRRDAPHSGFASTPIIANLDQPSLWIEGDQGKTNFGYTVLSNTDHNLQQTTSGLFNEISYFPGYHQDFYKKLNSLMNTSSKLFAINPSPIAERAPGTNLRKG